MSLAPELTAFLGGQPVHQPRGRPVVGYADQGARLRDHDHAEADTVQEDPTPRGVYERKPRAAKATQKPREGKGLRATRKARQAPADGARFGVFEDGTIHMNLPSCTGTIGAEDARALVGFLKRIGIDA